MDELIFPSLEHEHDHDNDHEKPIEPHPVPEPAQQATDEPMLTEDLHLQTDQIEDKQPEDITDLPEQEHDQEANPDLLIQAELNLDDAAVLVSGEDQTPCSLNLDQCDDSNLQDENDADISFKQDIDDALAMSPSSGLNSGSYILNGSNVSTHTFRKTEWDVKKLENYVRQSYGDMTPMENMDPAQMNRYLKCFFELAKKSDGMEYEPESLIGFMNSFERYLKTKIIQRVYSDRRLSKKREQF